MKRTIAILLSLTLLASLFLLAGCGKKEEPVPVDTPAAAVIDTANWTDAKLYSWVYAKYDEAVAEKDGLYINALDGSWWVSFTFANSDVEFEGDKAKHDAILADEYNTDVKTEEKTIGDYTYQATTYVANSQFFGSYFAALDPAIAPEGGFDPVQSILVDFFAEDPAQAAYIEAVIGTLNIHAA